jgi:ATP-dependent Clp protease ATP-binding subunit ClpA
MEAIPNDDAIRRIAGVVRRRRAGPRRPNRPLGRFLPIGPAEGVAIPIARRVAEALYGDPDALLRFDTAGYKDGRRIGLLVGPPPDFLGYGPPGLLIEPVRLRPEQVVLLDRIEKAHADAQNMLLQIAEEGSLCDNYGRHVDFRGTIVLVTTSAGVPTQGVIRPELFGLLDDVIDIAETRPSDRP